jgi:ariadne-1
MSEGISCVKTRCPETQCPERVPESYFRMLVDPTVCSKYNEFCVKNFIESCKFMHLCPSAGCDKVAVGTGITNVNCLCGEPFCFRCGEQAHDPCTCDMLMMWLQKCKDDSETANWLLVNTKRCPKCDSRIEKNQGCNHMVTIFFMN